MNRKYKQPLTLEDLAARPDSDINYSDIAELDETFWHNAKLRPPRARPNVSLRLPEDVIAFFKADNPRGYTARMAAVLSAYVNARQRRD